MIALRAGKLCMTRNERCMAIHYFAKIKKKKKTLYFIIDYGESISIKIYLCPHDVSIIYVEVIQCGEVSMPSSPT